MKATWRRRSAKPFKPVKPGPRAPSNRRRLCGHQHLHLKVQLAQCLPGKNPGVLLNFVGKVYMHIQIAGCDINIRLTSIAIQGFLDLVACRVCRLANKLFAWPKVILAGKCCSPSNSWESQRAQGLSISAWLTRGGSQNASERTHRTRPRTKSGLSLSKDCEGLEPLWFLIEMNAGFSCALIQSLQSTGTGKGSGSIALVFRNQRNTFLDVTFPGHLLNVRSLIFPVVSKMAGALRQREISWL